MSEPENPYESPTQPPGESETHHVVREPFPYYLPIVQFSLRLLGVYLAAGGISSVTQNLVEFALQESFLHSTLKAALVGNALWAAFGVHLVLDGRWLIRNVFAVGNDLNRG